MDLAGRRQTQVLVAAASAALLACASADTTTLADDGGSPDAAGTADAAPDAGSTDGGEPSDSSVRAEDATTPLFGPFTPFSNGISVAEGGGDHDIIIYGGYTAKLPAVESWATALVPAAGLRPRHIYAIQGPQDVSYAAKEIKNSSVVARYLREPAPTNVTVIAHSSGSYVAHELLSQLDGAGLLDGTGALIGKVDFRNLDGGTGLPATTAKKLRSILCIYAEDATLAQGRSANATTMLAGCATNAVPFRVGYSSLPTGCNDGARWCLHDAVVTTRPHNPANFDLARDYADFQGRAVVTDYLR
jgi:hypothetical protein